MFICSFCGRQCANKGSFKNHVTSCKSNPDRKPGFFTGLTHTVESKKKFTQKKYNKVPENLLDMSSRTVSKIMKRMKACCSNCGWDKTSLDLHHIVAKADGGSNSNDNLTALCPNCHRMAHEGSLTVFKSVMETMGDSWREHYYAHE